MPSIPRTHSRANNCHEKRFPKEYASSSSGDRFTELVAADAVTSNKNKGFLPYSAQVSYPAFFLKWCANKERMVFVLCTAKRQMDLGPARPRCVWHRIHSYHRVRSDFRIQVRGTHLLSLDASGSFARRCRSDRYPPPPDSMGSAPHTNAQRPHPPTSQTGRTEYVYR